MKFFYSPTGNLYEDNKDSFSAETFELELSEENGLLRQKNIIPFTLLKPETGWSESNEPEDHLDMVAIKITKSIKSVKNILCFSYKDISLANRLKEKNSNIDCLFSITRGLIGDHVENKTEEIIFESLKELKIKYDLIIIRHYLEHFENIDQLMRKLNQNLNDQGILFLEVPDCSQFISNKNPLFLWEQHRWYFTFSSLSDWLLNKGWNSIETYSEKYLMEPSLCFILKKSDLVDDNIKKLSANTNKKKQNFNFEIFDEYLNSWKKYIRNSVYKIAIFGIGHNSDRFLQLTNTKDQIHFLFDDSPNKKGKFIANCDIRISSNKKNIDPLKTVILLGVHPRYSEKFKNSLISEYNFKNVYSIFNNAPKL